MIWTDLKKKKRTRKQLQKNTWYDFYDWLTNYIPESIKNPWVVLKSFFKKTKDYSLPKHVKTVYGGGKKPSKLKI